MYSYRGSLERCEIGHGKCKIMIDMQSVVKFNEISFILRRFKMAATASHHVFIISGRVPSRMNSNAFVATRGASECSA